MPALKLEGRSPLKLEGRSQTRALSEAAPLHDAGSSVRMRNPNTVIVPASISDRVLNVSAGEFALLLWLFLLLFLSAIGPVVFERVPR